MGKSLEEIWEKMQQDLKSRKDMEMAKEKEVFEIRERQRQEYLKRNKMYEALSSQAIVAAGSAGGSSDKIRYKVAVDTLWIYPQADIDYVESTAVHLGGGLYQAPSFAYVKSGNTYDFRPTGPSPSVAATQSLTNFYEAIYFQTAVSQPNGNQGFSLGVGTVLEANRRDRIVFMFNGMKVVEFALMKQITSQSSLPSGGNSPDGTVGWGSIYCDWNLDGAQDATNIAPTANNLFGSSTFVDGLVFKPY